MIRRSNDVKGMVNFPIHSEEYKSSGEGGMFVRLVVIPNDRWLKDPKNYSLEENACSGGLNYIVYDDSFVTGDDSWETDGFRSRREAQHFPNINDSQIIGYKRYLSIGYHAVITLGSTGWSGWSDKAESYWQCTFEDLTIPGQQIYKLMQDLYPNSKIELLTWLDT